MPLLNSSNMQNHTTSGAYGFSATRIEDLGASEYTLGLIVVDVSGSVSAFRKDIELCIQEIVKSCRHNPRADNMMLRLVAFDDKVSEIHGYKPLIHCHESDYDGCITIGGTTALYDATYNGVVSAAQYGEALCAQDFDVNAAVFVITDGMDNASKATRAMVGDALSAAITDENLESVVSVLIGVNTDGSGLNQYLRDFKNDAGFTEYVEIKKATKKELAKLGGFVSRSISSQSKALGSGGAASLSF